MASKDQLELAEKKTRDLMFEFAMQLLEDHHDHTMVKNLSAIMEENGKKWSKLVATAAELSVLDKITMTQKFTSPRDATYDVVPEVAVLKRPTRQDHPVD